MRDRRHALKLTLAYAGLGLAWIVITDWLVGWLLPADSRAAQLVKGITFVAVTALTLYALVRRWEHERERRTEELRAQRARFEALLANIFDMVVVVGDDGGLEFQSDSVSETLGYPPEEIAEKPRLRYVHPDDRAELERSLRAAREQPGVPQFAAYRVQHADGRWLDFESLGVRPLDERVGGTILSTRDVTARKEAERELRAKEDQLRQAQKMEAIGRLAGGVAHDFNNLLTVMLTFATVVRDDAGLSDESAADLKMIEEAAHQAAGLTRQLLLFSRASSAEPAQLDLGAQLEGLRKMLGRVIGEDVALELDLADQLPPVYMDAGQLQQVLMNLAVNARDAMPRGGELVIRASTEEVGPDRAGELGLPAGRYACIRVEDDGAGIPDDILPHVFEPFFTTKEAGRGTGLGLATSYGIVKHAGGWIDVQSEPGVGTTFDVYLPERRGADARLAETPTGDLQGRGERVLLVEDDDALRAAVRRLLVRAGYRVDVAASGDDVGDLSDQGPFDLLLTDVVMPGESGRDLAHRVAAAGVCDRVLYVSGYAAEELMRRDVGAQVCLLRKPFTEEELLGHVRQALDTECARVEVPALAPAG